MKKVLLGIVLILIGLVLFFALQQEPNTNVVKNFDDGKLLLQIPLENTVEERVEFRERLIEKGFGNWDLRDLYEEYLSIIGVNGIVGELNKFNAKCHDEAHDLGKVIYSEIGRVGPALRTCNDACYSGCMHGVFMETFTIEEHEHDENTPVIHEHVWLPEVKKQIPEICYSEEVTQDYLPGDCAHGVGHAIMWLSEYNITESLEVCQLFDTDAMRYYCTTGNYMEYVHNYKGEEPENASIFYPCDEYENPAACFRYQMNEVFDEHYTNEGKFPEMVEECEKLPGMYRTGCFHGLGNSHMSLIASGAIDVSVLCSFGTETDQYVCIDGAMERMGKYYPEIASGVCESLEGWRLDVCMHGATKGMYDLEKSMQYYITF